MKTTKHTPGPWTVESNEEFIEIWNQNTWIANVQTEHKNHAVNNFANANLIAAAPEMLEALEKCAEVLRQYGGIPGPDPFYLDKLIAKARGEK